MHNCKETRELFTELLLDGVDFRSDEAISAELSRCAECRAEFEALSATLRMTSRVSEAAAPAEDYWPDYHSKLRQRLVNAQTTQRLLAHRRKGTRKNSGLSLSLCDLAREHSLFTRFLKTSVPVPLPLGIGSGSSPPLCLFRLRFALHEKMFSRQTTPRCSCSG